MASSAAQAIAPAEVDWQRYVLGFSAARMSTAVILKPYISGNEPGVVFIALDEWGQLLRPGAAEKMAERYSLILSTSWSLPYHVPNVVFPRVFPGSVYALISNTVDLKHIPLMSQLYVPIPLFASSWADPSLFSPRPRKERDIDILMVSSFAKLKRHSRLFEALRTIDSSVRAVLVGTPQYGRSADDIWREARAFGVDKRIEVLTSQPNSVVRDLLCRSRVSVIFSRREGSCVAVAESLFADTPVGIESGAHVGSSAFVNERTGMFLTADLAQSLTRFLSAADSFSPRAWACGTIDCHTSSKLQNDFVKAHSVSRGQAWTRDLAPMRWAPYPQVIAESDHDACANDRDWIRKNVGVEIG